MSLNKVKKEYSGIEAFRLIDEGLLKVRDTYVNQINLNITENQQVFSLMLKNEFDNTEIEVNCSEIIEIEFSYFENDPVYIEDFKIQYNNGIYYLSIDPDNSIEDIVETDCNKLKFKNLYLSVT